MKSYKSAKGLKGILLGSNTFRVYDKTNPEGFRDYDLVTCNMSITITDDDAFIYNDEYIDFSKETLGYRD